MGSEPRSSVCWLGSSLFPSSGAWPKRSVGSIACRDAQSSNCFFSSSGVRTPPIGEQPHMMANLSYGPLIWVLRYRGRVLADDGVLESGLRECDVPRFDSLLHVRTPLFRNFAADIVDDRFDRLR